MDSATKWGTSETAINAKAEVERMMQALGFSFGEKPARIRPDAITALYDAHLAARSQTDAVTLVTNGGCSPALLAQRLRVARQWTRCELRRLRAA